MTWLERPGQQREAALPCPPEVDEPRRRSGGGQRAAGTVGDLGDVEVGMKLKVRVVQYCRQGAECWYADIDDADDRQPDDPYWYVDGCRTQAEALAAACAQLLAFDRYFATGRFPSRISQSASSAA
jgi:hypothetical protein